MKAASTRLGAAPRTPTGPSYRRFGTVLSVNSPAAGTPSVKKKARVRNNIGAARNSIPEETIVFDGQDVEKEYTVTFDVGPVGLKIDPATCRVQRIVGDDSPARAAGLIQEGDAVVAVNGVRVESYDDAIAILKDMSVRRSISFARSSDDSAPIVAVEGPQNPSSVFPGRLIRAALVQTPPPSRLSFSSPLPNSIEFISARNSSTQHVEDASMECEDEEASALLLPRVLSRAHQRNHSVLVRTKGEAIASTMSKEADVPLIASTPAAADELELTRRELQGATNLLQQLHDKLEAVETENATLRQPKQQNTAIKEMEFKMRIGALESELKHVKESKSKLKERVCKLDQQLHEQSTKDRTVLDHTKQELSEVTAELKETILLLEKTRKELASTKKGWHDETVSLQREKDRLTATLDQHASNLERSVAAKLQSDARIQQTEDARTILEDELQRIRLQLQESGSHAAGKNEQLLDSIRKKDAQLEELRLEMVATQSINATLRADLSEKEAFVRRATVNLDQLAAEKNSISSELASLSSIFEVTVHDKQRLEMQLSKVEEKLSERNQTIDSLKDAAKTKQDDLCSQLAEKDDALAESAHSIDALSQDKESLLLQLSGLRNVAQSTGEEESRLRERLESARNELAGLRKSSVTEKCHLLKRIEEMEGELIDCHVQIQRKDQDLADTRAKLDAAYLEIDRVSSDFAQSQASLTQAVDNIEDKEYQIEDLKKSSSANEERFSKEIVVMKEQLVASAGANETLTSENHALTTQVKNLFKVCKAACLTELKLRVSLNLKKLKLAETQSSRKTEHDNLQGEIDALQLQLKSSEQLVDSTKRELTTALSNLDTANSEIELFTNTVAQAESDLQAAAKRIIHGTEQLESAKAAAGVKEKELNSKIASKTQQLTDFSGTIAALKTEKHSLSTQVQQLQAADELSAATVSKLRAELEWAKLDLREIRSSTQKEINGLLYSIGTYKMELDERRQLVDTTAQSLSTALAELDATKTEVTRLASALSVTEANHIGATNAVEEGNMMIASLKEEAYATNRAFERELVVKSDLLIKLDKQMTELTESRQLVHTTKQSLSDTLAELALANNKVDRLSSELSAAEANFMAATNEAEQGYVMIESLKEEAADIQRQMEQVLDERTNQLTDLQRKLDTQKTEIAASGQLIDTMKESLSDSVAELAVARTEVGRLTFGLLTSEASFMAATNAAEEANMLLDTLKERALAKQLELERELTVMTEQQNDFLSKLDTQMLDLAASRQLVETTKQSLSDTQTDLSAAKAEVGLLESELLASQASFRAATNAVEEAHKAIHTLEQNAEAKQRELDEKTEQLSELHSKLETQEMELTASRQLVAEFDTTRLIVETLSSELVASEANFFAATNATEGANMLIRTLKDNVKVQRRELDEKTKHLTELHSKLDTQNTELAANRQLVDTTKQSLFDVLAEFDTTKMNVEKLSSDLLASEASFRAATKACGEANVIIENLKETSAAKQRELERELDEKIYQLAESSETIGSLSAKIVLLERKLLEAHSSAALKEDGLLQQLDTLKIEQSSVLQDLSKANESNKKHLADVLKLETELKLLVAADQARIAETEEMNRKTSELQLRSKSEIVFRDDAIEILTRDKNALVEQVNELRMLANDAREVDAKLRADADQLRLQLAKTEADFQDSQDLVEMQTRELETILTKLMAAKARNDKLLRELQQSESSSDSLSRLVDSSNAQVIALKDTLQTKQKQFERELAGSKQDLVRSLETIKYSAHEKEMLSERIGMLENAVIRSEKAESTLHEEISKYKAGLFAAVSSASTTEGELQQRVEMLKIDFQDLQSLLSKRDESIVVATEELACARSDNDLLTSELAQLRDTVEDAKIHVTALESKLVDAERREESLRVEADKRLRAKLSAVSADADVRLSEAQIEVSALKARMRSLESLKADAVNEIESLKATACSLSTEMDRLLTSAVENENEISLRQKECKELNRALAVTEAELGNKLECLIAKDASLQQAQMQVTELEARVMNLVTESAKSRDAMSSEIILLKQENATLTTESGETTALLRSMGAKVSDTEALIDSVREELRAENEALKALTASAAATQWALEHKFESLSDESEKYRELSTDLNNECKSLKAEVESLQGEVVALKEQCSSATARFETQELALARKQKESADQIAAEKGNSADLSDHVRALKLERDHDLREWTTIHRRQDEQIQLLQYEADLKTKRQTEWTKEREVEMKGYRQCREELRLAKNRISRLEDSLERARGEVEHLTALSEQTAEQSASAVDMLSQRHDDNIHRLQEEKDELEESLRKAENERKSATDRLLATEAGITQLRSEREKVIAEKNDLSMALHETKDALSELQGELENRQNLSLDSDSMGSPLKKLSKSDITAKCLKLQEDLIDAENRLTETSNDATRRSEYVRRLATDLDAMSHEIESLVAANDLLEARLKEVASLKESSDASAIAAQNKADLLENQSRSLTLKLDALSTQNTALTDQLQSLNAQTKTENRALVSQKRDLENELSKLNQSLSNIEQEKCKAEESISDARQELSTLRESHLKSSDRIQKLESEVSDLTAKLTDATREASSTRIELQNKINYFENLVSALETDCMSLRSNVTELELEIESKNLALEDREEKERTLSANLEKQHHETRVAEDLREDVVAKLTEASRVVMLQKDSIKALDKRAVEAERNAASLSERVKKLQASIKHMESGMDDTLLLQQFHDLEIKCRSLEEDRSDLTREASSLRDELRQARREHSDHTKTTAALQTRMHSLKSTLETTKTQLSEARLAKEESHASFRQLESELDNKQMEVEHLKAKVQVLTAASARMKANNLLQESAHQKENQASESSIMSEISMLKSELTAKSSKLESLSETFRSQQQVLALTQSLEGQLIRFIEEVIAQTDNIFGKIAARSEKLYGYADRFALEDDMEALDLAGFEKQERNLDFFRSSLDSLSLLIPNAVSQLDERRAQLKSWKQQGSDRFPPKSSTPNSKMKGTLPDSPAIVDAFQRMKAVLNDEILSPNKIRTANSDRLDVECLKNVIHALEGQIDALLMDLEAANEALRTKDLLFADLEQLVSHHESARDALNRKVAKMEARLKREVSWKEVAEKELAQIRQGFPGDQVARKTHAEPAACKLAAGRLIVHAMDGRANAAKAVAFRQWACQTSALRAVSKQGQAAAALARQLEETREKLVILKRHLKKTRRGPRDCGGLDRIAEEPKSEA